MIRTSSGWLGAFAVLLIGLLTFLTRETVPDATVPTQPSPSPTVTTPVQFPTVTTAAPVPFPPPRNLLPDSFFTDLFTDRFPNFVPSDWDDRPGCEIPSGWSQVCDAASFDPGVMYAVTTGGPGLVAVGANHLDYYTRQEVSDLFSYGDEVRAGTADAVVWTSPDGFTWSRVPHDEAVFGGPGEQRMVSVTAGGPGLVAVGGVWEKLDGTYEMSDAAVWTSPDGLEWSRVPHDEAVFARSGGLGDKNEQMVSVVTGGPGLVAVGFDSVGDCGWNAAVWTSPDGLTWSRVPDDRGCAGPYDRMLSVTVGPSGLVAVGEEHSPGENAAVWNE